MKRFSLLVFFSLWSFVAFADRVPPAPEVCPPGSIGDTGHEGPHCVPLDCTADSDCKDGKVCQEQPLCIEEKMLAPGDDPVKRKYLFVYEACTAGAKCSEAGASCLTGKRCVSPKAAPQTPTKPPASNPTQTPSKKSGCAVSVAESGTSGLVLLFGFFFLLVRVKRRTLR
jgi:MYXO-CTERM domain-containing protein